MNNEKNTEILSLRQIAWWWRSEVLETQLTESEKEAWADLPVIQRGFVWNVNQIERLWDSIARRFPIGSVMLRRLSASESEEPPVAKKQEGNQEGVIRKENLRRYFLLDGQQRATSIALGFKNVWSNSSNQEEKDRRTLWVDISKKPKDERAFLFRMTSQAHPWGYSDSMNATQEPKRISAEEMREAHKAILAVCSFKNLTDVKKPYEIPVNFAFPWHTEAPVPLAFILESLPLDGGVDVERVSRTILDKMHTLPVWDWYKNPSDTGAEEPFLEKLAEKCKKLETILKNPGDNAAAQFRSLVEGLHYALNKTEIPAPVLTVYPQTLDENTPEQQDPEFNLFERINTAGTALTREEINYSMLKSVWRESSGIIDHLLDQRQICGPARLVSLLSRLLLTVEERKGNTTALRDSLTIPQFRKAIESGLGKRLEKFCRDGDGVGAKLILSRTWELLTGMDYGLPAVLAADITWRNEDLVLLLMTWVYRIEEERLYGGIDESIRRSTLGFVTAIHWFSPNVSGCVRFLGGKLLACEKDLATFFGPTIMERLLEYKINESRVMNAISDPKSLHRVLGSWNRTGEEPQNLWEMYFSQPSPEQQDLYAKLYPDDDSHKAISDFLNMVCHDKRLLLYAQRSYVGKWFGWFDPTQIARVNDHNVPWDFDHILPWSWVGNERIYSPVPKSVRVFVNSIGNLRAWPAEYNRSKGNRAMFEEEIAEYGLLSKTDIYDASFVKHHESWNKLEELSGGDFWSSGNELEIFRRFHPIVTARIVDIYEEWHTNLYRYLS